MEVCARPASGSRSSPNFPITAWCNTGCPAPASLSRCWRSPRPRPTRRGSCSSGPTRRGPRRDHLPGPRQHGAIPLVAAATGERSGCLRPRCCSSAGSDRAPGDRRSVADRLTPRSPHRPDRPGRGGPLHFTPHDFRRLFITDAILNGLPPHIAQVIHGHQDISVTMGYRPSTLRRRSRPPGVHCPAPGPAHRRRYRSPTDEVERSSATSSGARSPGICGRLRARCIHEHAVPLLDAAA